MRAGYIALIWPPASDTAAKRADALAAEMVAAGWVCAHTASDLRLWSTIRDPPDVCRLPRGGGLIIGQAFERAEGACPKTAGASAAARWLVRSHWGRYVALLRDPQRDRFCVLRDPSGGLPAFAWSLGEGLHAVASQMSGLPGGIAPRRPFLNWDRIAEFVAKPAACANAVLVDDVTAVQPGELLTLDDGYPTETIWSPSTFAADPIQDPEAAGRALRARLDGCVQTLVGDYDRTLLEISGGLDSAILAGTLSHVGLTHRVAEGVNIAFGRPESDEQAYATAVAERAGLRLVQRRHAPDAIDLADLDDLAGEVRPSANGVDPKWDRDEIERVRATGARAIISGQGGDAVFMQMASAGIVADAWRNRGWRTLGDPIVPNVARRLRRSVWGVLREARAEHLGRQPPPEDFWSSLISRDVRHATRDLAPPWLLAAAAMDLPPGKRLHIHALARFLQNEGPSRRRREADILYPLFAQPVLELCLRIPTPVLAGASYDRAYARAVFADRLPPSVLHRRAKGMVTVYFARLIANGLPALRPFLVDGCLADAGVLDRATLQQALTPEHLIWMAKPSDILWAVATEAWVRHWQKQTSDSPAAPRRR